MCRAKKHFAHLGSILCTSSIRRFVSMSAIYYELVNLRLKFDEMRVQLDQLILSAGKTHYF